MVLTKEEKVKLLEKARAVRAANLAKKREASGIIPQAPPVVEPEPAIVEPKESKSISQGEEKPKKPRNIKPKEQKKTLELNTVEDIRKEEEKFEIKEEHIKLKAPTKKKVIRRVIEVEESDTDEEVVEEIVKVPKTKKKEVKINRQEIKDRAKSDKEQRLMVELFGI
jgi:hypothetical protein